MLTGGDHGIHIRQARFTKEFHKVYLVYSTGTTGRNCKGHFWENSDAQILNHGGFTFNFDFQFYVFTFAFLKISLFSLHFFFTNVDIALKTLSVHLTEL